MGNQSKEPEKTDLPQEAQGGGISEKAIFNWEASSFKKGEQGLRWYLVAAVVILGLIGYSAWQGDWFIIIITIIVSAVLFWYLHAVHPTNVLYEVTPIGIKVDQKLFPFSEMHSFWMIYNDRVKELHVVFRKKYLPALVVNIESVDALLLKNYLLKKIPEQEGREESLADRLIRKLGL